MPQHKLKQISRAFIRFAFVSGCGWLIDFCLMLAMVYYVHVVVGVANFISSFAAVTFVWFVALKTVFSTKYRGNSYFLIFYWGWQFFSILFYSFLLSQFIHWTYFVEVAKSFNIGWQALAKIIITPFNLVTNFLFMLYLTRFMDKKGLTIGK